MLVIANRRSDIASALRIAREFGLRIVIRGGAEAWQAAPELAAAKVPVVLEPLTDVPRFDALNARLDNATLLRQAGVTVIAAQRDAAFFRDLRTAAGNEVRNGMSWDDALRSVTLAPAQALGIGERAGSLEAGKSAIFPPCPFSSAASTAPAAWASCVSASPSWARRSSWSRSRSTSSSSPA
jgi:imidazolonepropionase-like amidohydrolase